MTIKQNLIKKIKGKKSGILLYSIVPPKVDSSAEKTKNIALKQIERIQQLPVDGLILYDIQDEQSRTDKERPFPFIKTLDPCDYARTYFTSLHLPKIIYRSVGKYSQDTLTNFLKSIDKKEYISVFVGAGSPDEHVALSIQDAYAIKNSTCPELLLGGVTIPERHKVTHDEHERINFKTSKGCSFFVSQAVYDVKASLKLLKDYHAYCTKNGTLMRPIIFTLTPCGSAKTLEFMKWLGISIPQDIENKLIKSDDFLETSIKICHEIWETLENFSIEHDIPIGCNIENVGSRKVETQAAINLLHLISSNNNYFS